MANYKTVPNQKVVKVNKEVCNKQNIYATINITAMEKAAQELAAGAFKLWVYFAKNQHGYEFALSSKEIEANFGIKIKQYNNAVDELIEKGYLVQQGESNSYLFMESAVIPKGNNENETLIPKGNNAVIPKSNNGVMPKSNNALLPKEIRNNTNTTLDNTIDNTDLELARGANSATARGAVAILEQIEIEGESAEILTAKEALKKYGLTACANRVATGKPNCFWISGELVRLV